MARAIWQGSISFGLVEIPVGLYPAERAHQLDLTMLDKRNFAPVGYSRYNKVTKQEVPWAEIVRGYEYEKGQYVVLGEGDLRRANPALTKTISILRFVDRAEIDPIYYDKPYYLGPQRKRSKGYVLLRETLEQTGTVGIARIVIRTREHVAYVGVRGEVLVLQLLRYPDEVRDPSSVIEDADVDLSAAGVTAKEIQMATRIVEGMKEPWDPNEYVDQYTEDLLKLVEQKVESGAVHEISEEEEEPVTRDGGVIDLMPLLKKSLEQTRRGGARADGAGRRKTPARRASKPRGGGRRSA